MNATMSFHTGFMPLSAAEADRDCEAIRRELGSRYRVDRYIARGGFATVWQAVDLVEGLDVAIKRLDPTVTRNRDFFRELRALLVLDHPNVVRLVNFLDGTASRFLILELCRGGSLRAAISAKRRGAERWVEAAVKRIVIQIAAGLAAAHAAGLTHRDLKPENVLFAHGGDASPVKLADFGLAGLFHDDTGRLRSLTGSPAYMAPEQFAGRFMPASDVYALGIIAYELLAGDLPFRGSPEELARQHLNDVVPMASMPGPWSRLLPRMLAKNAAERPDAAEVMAMLSSTPQSAMHEEIDAFVGVADALIPNADRIGIAFADRFEHSPDTTVPLAGVRQWGTDKTGEWYRTDAVLAGVRDGEMVLLASRPRGVDHWLAWSEENTLKCFELVGEQVRFVVGGTMKWSLTIPGAGLKRHFARHSAGGWAVTAFDREPTLQFRDDDAGLLRSITLPGIAWQVVPWSREHRYAIRVLTGTGFAVYSTRTRGAPYRLPGSDGASLITAAENGIAAMTAAGELRLWDARRRSVPLNFALPPGEVPRGLALTTTIIAVLSIAGGRSRLRGITRPDLGAPS
jgi:hypothetical protein